MIRAAASTQTFGASTENPMVTCYLRYVIDPDKVAEFENYARMWISLVNKFGGKHHGYFLPHEGPNNIALALFSFQRWLPMRSTGRRLHPILTAKRPLPTTKKHAASSASSEVS